MFDTTGLKKGVKVTFNGMTEVDTSLLTGSKVIRRNTQTDKTDTRTYIQNVFRKPDFPF